MKQYKTICSTSVDDRKYWPLLEYLFFDCFNAHRLSNAYASLTLVWEDFEKLEKVLTSILNKQPVDCEIQISAKFEYGFNCQCSDYGTYIDDELPIYITENNIIEAYATKPRKIFECEGIWDIRQYHNDLG